MVLLVIAVIFLGLALAGIFFWTILQKRNMKVLKTYRDKIKGKAKMQEHISTFQDLIRCYYCKNVYYRIRSNQIEIIMKILRWEYTRRYMISDITVVTKVIYKGKAGSIHFGDAENKYWERGVGYAGKINPVVTGGGLLRPSDKYHSGILYGLEDVDYVYQIIMSLKCF